MSKGGDFERNISKLLTEWLTGKKKPYMYWRQDASGGLATVHRENIHMTGDITYLHPDAKFLTDVFTIECKTGYPTTSFWQHFFNAKKFNIKEFWEQCVTDAKKSNKFPMLVYRKKGRKPIIGVDECIFNYIYPKIGDINRIVTHFGNSNLPSVILFDFNSFIDNVTPDDIKEIKKECQK